MLFKQARLVLEVAEASTPTRLTSRERMFAHLVTKLGNSSKYLRAMGDKSVTVESASRTIQLRRMRIKIRVANGFYCAYGLRTSFQAVRVEGGYPNRRSLILSLHLSS